MRSSREARRFAKALVTRNFDFEFERIPYRIANISNSKLLSLFRSELNCARSRPGPPWYPVQLQIEPSTACSLSCPLCPAGLEGGDKPKANMSFDTYRSLIDEVGNHAIVATLWMWGEPCMNRKLPEMIAYARSKNIATVTSTNGQHIQTKEDAENLVASGLDCLIVALDGATQDVYSKYRVGGSIERILRCLEMVKQAKDAAGSDRPVVNVRTVVMKHNEHELGDIEKIARRVGADFVTRKTACMADYCGSDTDEQFAPTNPLYRRFEYSNGKRIRRPIQQFRCRRPWNRMTVASDGTVISCEFDYSRSAPFGQGKDTFVDIWRGQAASAFRRQFIKDRSAYQFCLDCHYRDRSSNKCIAEIIQLRQMT